MLLLLCPSKKLFLVVGLGTIETFLFRIVLLPSGVSSNGSWENTSRFDDKNLGKNYEVRRSSTEFVWDIRACRHILVVILHPSLEYG